MRTIKVWRDPYDTGFNVTEARYIDIKPGVTVLVGCNGAGKTTLLRNIKEFLSEENVPHVDFDNLHDGGHNAMDKHGFKCDFKMLSLMMTSSEGENIRINVTNFMRDLDFFLKTGKKEVKGLARSFMSEEDIKKSETPSIINERWFLFDAVDSGFSIDNVIDLKDAFHEIIKECIRRGLDAYIVISANEFELVDGEDCIDVIKGKHRQFKSYKLFKNYILKTREYKIKRYKAEDKSDDENSSE